MFKLIVLACVLACACATAVVPYGGYTTPYSTYAAGAYSPYGYSGYSHAHPYATGYSTQTSHAYPYASAYSSHAYPYASAYSAYPYSAYSGYSGHLAGHLSSYAYGRHY